MKTIMTYGRRSAIYTALAPKIYELKDSGGNNDSNVLAPSWTTSRFSVVQISIVNAYW